MNFRIDESKRDNIEWQTTLERAMGRRKWLHEMEMSEVIHDGKPVYESYIDAFHCAKGEADKRIFGDIGRDSNGVPEGRIATYDGSIWLAGMDAGNTLNPAICIGQLTLDDQLLIPLEIQPLEGYGIDRSMEGFLPYAKAILMRMLPSQWSSLYWGADHTVTSRNGTNNDTPQNVARKLGVRLHPMSNSWDPRISAATWAWSNPVIAEDGKENPRCIISARGCPVLRGGCLGKYQLAVSKSGDATGPGVVLLRPQKDGYSHIQDGFQIVCMMAKKIVDNRNKERKAVNRLGGSR